MPESSQPLGELPIEVTRPSATTTVIQVGGEVDLMTTPSLESAIAAQLDGGVARNLVLDLTRVAFFGSSGLAALIKAGQAAEQIGVRLLLVAAGRVVLRPIEVTDTTSRFTIHESLAEALATCD